MGFERWVDYALDVPMYFVKRGDAYIDVADPRSGLSSRAGTTRFPAASDAVGLGQSSVDDLPRVRLKRYLEMRGADDVPWGRLPALPAFWVVCSTTT
jgi:glutamate--cysteine ligase